MCVCVFPPGFSLIAGMADLRHGGNRVNLSP